ncbi:MAG: hydantoinase/oxoprolinase family protein [Pseudomonadota bacterium]|jgi:N-methylhydantoinase A
MSGWAIGIDVGGTFTDIVARHGDGRVHSAKTPSTPDQSDGVIAAIARIAAAEKVAVPLFLADVALIVHGTTVATNALLEMRGARVGLITTEGFRDEIEFRRAYKESVFNPRLKAPPAICPRRYRIGVPERIHADGTIGIPLDEAAVREALAFFREEGIEAVAVAFLFSFLDTRHEQRVADIVREEMPQAHLSLSSDILPEIREFERISTTLVNAFVGPSVSTYLAGLEQKLKDAGYRGDVLVMQSTGGVLGIGETASCPVDTLLSGPAGGVTGGAYVGGIAGYDDLITVDMGGTSYDIAVIEKLVPAITTESWIGRYRIAKPMLDIHTIGAGGGSIAWVDTGGALRVGPESAGASPGPACYDRGGTRPTVTDANLVLGLLSPDRFLGGEMTLSLDAARDAIERDVARPLGLDVIAAAHAINEIVNHDMARATQYVTTRRGHDPALFALMAVGGAGALHAGRQAELLGLRTVIIPSSGPVFCALGDVVAPLKVARSRTFIASHSALDLDALNQAFETLQEQALASLPRGVAEPELRRFLDLRYDGEVHELTVPLRSRTRRITALNIDATLRAFHERHEALYAHADAAQPVEIQTLRLELVVQRPLPEPAPGAFAEEDPGAALAGTRPVHFHGAAVETAVYDGERLRPGHFIHGPAILEYWGTSIAVYPGQEALIDSSGHCVIEVGSESRRAE